MSSILRAPRSPTADWSISGGSTQLQYLSLNSTVTDGGLEHLRGLSQLQELSLHNTQVTDAGVNELKELPNVKINR